MASAFSSGKVEGSWERAVVVVCGVVTCIDVRERRNTKKNMCGVEDGAEVVGVVGADSNKVTMLAVKKIVVDGVIAVHITASTDGGVGGSATVK